MRRLRNEGFTLIELMIVVVIIGILAAIAIPRFTQVSNGAKQAEAESILRQICSLAEAERLRGTAAPASLAAITGWEAPVARYFGTWAFTPGGTLGAASAVKTDAALQNPSLNCDTGVLTLS